MGCQAIARYAASLPSGQVAGGAIFVAGFFTSLTGMGDDSITKDVEREWLTSPLSSDDVKSHLNKSVAVFSDNDPFVPLSNKEYFSNELGSKVIIEKGKHHFSGSEGIMEMPVVVQSILDISAR
jgi:predicted alpha/beta hydrolase family esterase